MTTTTAKKNSPMRKTRLPLTREERRAKLIKKITSSKEEAKKFLIEVGYLDIDGNVAEIYR